MYSAVLPWAALQATKWITWYSIFSVKFAWSLFCKARLKDYFLLPLTLNFANVRRLGSWCRIRLTFWGSLDWCELCDLQNCHNLWKFLLLKFFDNNTVVWKLCTLFLLTNNNSIQTEGYNFPSCTVIKRKFKIFTWKMFISFLNYHCLQICAIYSDVCNFLANAILSFPSLLSLWIQIW